MACCGEAVAPTCVETPQAVAFTIVVIVRAGFVWGHAFPAEELERSNVGPRCGKSNSNIHEHGGQAV